MASGESGGARLLRGGEAWLLGFAVIVSFSTVSSVYATSLPGSVGAPAWSQMLARVIQGVVCLCIALAAARESASDRSAFPLFACTCACSLSALFPMLAGFAAQGAPGMSLLLAGAAPVVRMGAYAYLWIAWMSLFARLDLRHMLVGYLLVHALSAAASLVLGMLPLAEGVLVGVVVAMPWAAWWMFARARRVVDGAAYACGESEPHPWAFPFVPVILMVAFTGSNLFVRGMLPGQTSIFATAGVIAACVIVLVVVRLRGMGSFDVWRLSGVAFVLTLAGLLGVHIAGTGWGIAASLCTNAGFALFNVFLCAVLCNISYRYGVSSMILFGFAKAADCLAYVIGRGLMNAAGGSGNAFALVVAVLATFLAMSFVVLVEARGNDPAWGIGLGTRRAGGRDGGMAARCAFLSREHGLTRREEEVLGLLARDMPASDIERELCVSNATVKTHTQAVYRKLGVHSRRELVERVVGDERGGPPARR